MKLLCTKGFSYCAHLHVIVLKVWSVTLLQVACKVKMLGLGHEALSPTPPSRGKRRRKCGAATFPPASPIYLYPHPFLGVQLIPNHPRCRRQWA